MNEERKVVGIYIRVSTEDSKCQKICDQVKSIILLHIRLISRFFVCMLTVLAQLEIEIVSERTMFEDVQIQKEKN